MPKRKVAPEDKLGKVIETTNKEFESFGQDIPFPDSEAVIISEPKEPEVPLKVKLKTNSKGTVISSLNSETMDDYDFARENLLNLIKKGNKALESIIQLAQESEHPRTYEVLGQLLKINADITKDLLGIKKSAAELAGLSAQREIANPDNSPQGKPGGPVFIGTTAELLQLISGDPKDGD